MDRSKRRKQHADDDGRSLRIGVVGLQAERFAQVRDRLKQGALLLQRRPQVVVRFDIARRQAQRFAVAGERLG